MTECATHNSTERKKNAAARRAAQSQAKYEAMKRLKRDYPHLSGPEAIIGMLEERLSVQSAMAVALDEIVLDLTEANELRYEGKTGEQIRGELQAWMQVNAQVAKLGVDYLKIGLDERKVQISEIQGRLLMGVLNAVIERLELTSDQRKIAAVVVPQELERVAIEESK